LEQHESFFFEIKIKIKKKTILEAIGFWKLIKKIAKNDKVMHQ
jgi:hypothetical protein